MYGADNYGYTGNPNLKPETSVSREIGYNNKGKSHMFDIAFYSTDVEDMITYSNSTYSNDSNGVSTMKGADIDFNYYVGNFSFVNNIALSSAEDSSGTWLKRRPHTIIRSGITYAKDSYYISPSILYYGDHRDIDSGNWSTITVKERTTGDLTAGYYLTQDSEIVLNVKNITDDHYERPDGYNQGGRNITIGWKMKF
jgi:vitamin B12 transporter